MINATAKDADRLISSGKAIVVDNEGNPVDTNDTTNDEMVETDVADTDVAEPERADTSGSENEDEDKSNAQNDDTQTEEE